MKENLEKIIKKTEQFLKSLKSKVTIGFLAAGLALGYASCGEDEENKGPGSEYSWSGETKKSKYNCDCWGEGLYQGIAGIYADSKSDAEALAVLKCNKLYPERNCSCECFKENSLSGGGSSKYPSCSEVPENYKGVCVNDNW